MDYLLMGFKSEMD